MTHLNTTKPLIMSQMPTPGTFTINNTPPIEAQSPLQGTLTLTNPLTISLSALQLCSSTLLFSIPANSLGALVVNDHLGNELLNITDRPFRANVQQLLSMLEREDRKLGASI
jgi:hypothetical protein